MDNDLKKFDKDGNPLNLVPLANRDKQANFYQRWMNDPNKMDPSLEDIKCELQLNALSTFEPLNFNIDYTKFKKEIEPWNNRWVPYLRRDGISNDREALLLVGMEGDQPDDYVSRPEACRKAGRYLDELEFSTPTELYTQLTSLHEILDYFSPLGRTMLIKTNAGGWFPPHKDDPLLTRTCFRVAAFIGNYVDHESYEWQSENKIWPIRANRAYYIDTRKTHRTHSWSDGSIHLIMNIPKTWENVMKLMSVTKHY